MAATRSAAMKLDWVKISSSLGLKGQTAASIATFKKRNDDARRKVNFLASQPQSVDFSQYRSILGNQAVVDEIEGQVKSFRPKTFDLGRQLKAIEAFEVQAIKSAEDTMAKVDEQLVELNKCLKNIQDTRPLADLTIDDFAKAEPRIDEYTAKLVSRGRWMWPGYQENFGNTAVF